MNIVILSRLLRRYGLTLFILLAVGLGSAHAQNPPSGITGSCSPNPIYVGANSICTFTVGGMAQGTVTVYANGVLLGTLPLDSNGKLTVGTSQFNPYPGGAYDLHLIYNPAQGSPYSSVTGEFAISVYPNKVAVTADTLTCSPYQLTVGNTATCKVHIPGGATGTVNFIVGGQNLSAQLDGNGDAVETGLFAGLSAGSYTIQATYSGDANFNGFTTTAAENITSAKPLPSAINVSCLPASVNQGATGSCQVAVGGGATGNVDIFVNGAQVASALQLNGGVASVQGLFGTLPAGAASVVAVYEGDTNFASVTGGTSVTITNGEASSVTNVSCTPEAIVANQSVTCTAQVGAGATGTVSFQLDGAAWGPAIPLTSGAATTPAVQNLPVGTHSIVAAYSGDGNFDPGSGPYSLVVNSQSNPPPTVTFSCAPSSIAAGSSTNCKAHVDGGATGGVIMYLGSQIMDGEGLDVDGNAVFQNVLAGASAGTYQLGAHYLGDINFVGGGSPSLNVTVTGQPNTAGISGSLNPTSATTGGQIAAYVSVAPGAVKPVTITMNGATVATVNLDANGTAAAMFNAPSTPGSYPVTFSYPGDSNFSSGTQTQTLTVTSSQTPTPAANGTLYSYSITQPDGTTSGYAPNGNIVAFTDLINGQWTAGYDPLNRITSATVTANNTNVTAQSFCWTYDSFGNRTLQARAPGALTQCAASTANGENYVGATYNTSNQLTNVSGEATWQGASNAGPWQVTLDPAGNTTQDANNLYWYDGEGRVCAVQSRTYTAATGYLYDAEGHRVAKGNITIQPNMDPCDMSTNNFSITNEYIPGPNGEQLTELTWNGQTGTPVHTNAYANGQLVATYTYGQSTSPALHFQFSDWLGTRRLQTDAAGNVEETCTGGSFGDEQNCPTQPNLADATGPTETHFTGKERDRESGNDYFGARYYGSSTGRFMSPDWSIKPDPVPYAKLDNPQSLNLYAYVLNNPLTLRDLSGHDCNGSKDQCAGLKAALALIKAADAKLPKGSNDRARLDKVLAFYGDIDTNHKVVVDFKLTDKGAYGETSTQNGVTSISLNAKTLETTGNAGRGETVSHEGTHGVDQQASGMPRGFTGYFQTERNAYEAEAAFDRGSGVRSETDNPPVWRPGITQAERNATINHDALSNAQADCANGGCR